MDISKPDETLTPLARWPDQIVVIGCGGVGSYLVPALLRTVRNHADPEESPEVVLVDGDTLEPRNMERQLFTNNDVGRNKAGAIGELNRRYYPKLEWSPHFFTGGEAWLHLGALLFACVDNHPGRANILAASDRASCDAIICGNGYTDAEAMFYSPTTMRGTKQDPRVMFPEILTTHEGDPLAIGMGCTGEAQQQTPQLAIANFMAAAYALHLMWFHYQEAHKLEREFRGHSPLRHSSNASKLATMKMMEAT